MSKGTWFLAAALCLGGAVPAAAQYTTTCPIFAVSATCQGATGTSQLVSFSKELSATPVFTGSCAEPLSCNAQGTTQTEACPSGGGNVLYITDSEGNFCGSVVPGGCEQDGFAPTATCAFVGTPGQPNCHGKTVSGLNRQFGSVDKVAQQTDISVQELQDAIEAYCGN
jgi:hypothetical protein